ncbi:MAG: membrane protein [Planctomycetaceae bacterium]|nr:MAG: membrane protein [Planctomycetaceae bacterium]
MPYSVISLLGGTALTLWLSFTGLWLLSLPLKNASLVDIFWGLGFILQMGVVWWWREPTSWRAGLLLLLVLLWGLRLSGYLAWRNGIVHEDRRYAAMRAQHGASCWWISLGTVFWLQAAIQWILGLPLQIALIHDASTPWGLRDTFGLLLWTGGMLFEVVGDWQLARFRADPHHAGQVCDRGLWRYTRHPNYFGECCLWWGIYLLACGSGAGWTIVSPLLLTYLLLRVSGVTLLERHLLQSRPDYADYCARTNSFFPWFPRPGRRISPSDAASRSATPSKNNKIGVEGMLDL